MNFLMKTNRMISLLVICLFISHHIIFATDTQVTIYTPEGRPVTAYIMGNGTPWYDDDDAQDDIDYWTLNAEIIETATAYYNCHGYAWAKSENMGTYWIGYVDDDQELKYSTDTAWSNDSQPSYLSASSSEATHGCYEQTEDHSIRVIQNSYPVSSSGQRTHVSKWGSGPLVQHAPAHDVYALKDTSIISYFKLKTTHSGTLSSYPKTWIGAGGISHTITGNLTIPSNLDLTIKTATNISVNSGITMTVGAGSEITFENDIFFNIYGTLNVNGTSNNKVHLDFVTLDFNGIWFYDGSSGTINNAIIRDAKYGVYIDEASPTIINCTIFNCQYGILSKDNSPNIENNKIYDISYCGIWTQNSSATIENCEIYNCDYGIRSYYDTPTIETNEIYDIDYYGVFLYSGSPTITDNYIHDTDNYGLAANGPTNTYISDNTIKNCMGGIVAFGNQTIKLYDDGLNKIEGYTSSGHAVYVTGGTAHLGEYHDRGNNSFIRNTSNTVIYNSSTNEVLAEKNYWGGSPQSSWFYGDVEWSFPLSSPSGGVGSSLGKAVEPDITPDRILFSEAMELADSNEHKEASAKFKALVNDYPDSRFAGLSVAWAMSSHKYENDFKAQTSYLTSLKEHKNKNVRDNSLLWLAALESEVGNKSAVEKIVNSTSINEKVGVEIRLNWANDLLNKYNDEKSAEAVFEELRNADALVSTLETISAIKSTALNSEEIGEIPKFEDNKENPVATVISESKLNASYPNPFNPTTTISYQLKENGFVSLIVYNSIGQVVVELVNQQKEKGIYNVDFNASNLASGLYIYRLQVNTPDGKGNYVQAKKMLLLR